MTKIVINTCFGGFGLSEEAMHAYAKHKGLTLYPEKIAFGKTYWTVPPEERVTVPTTSQWTKMTAVERTRYNKKYKKQTIYDRDIPRDDPALIWIVEELGERVNGHFANLKVVEIPDDVEWEIEEYDGSERVAEVHRIWD